MRKLICPVRLGWSVLSANRNCCEVSVVSPSEIHVSPSSTTASHATLLVTPTVTGVPVMSARMRCPVRLSLISGDSPACFTRICPATPFAVVMLSVISRP